MEMNELLREQDIVLQIPAKGKRSALAKVAGWLGERVGRSQDGVLAAMLERERLGSTGIGHGVAVPHGRLDGIDAPAAMLATLERPVWFGSPDLAPVDLLLALLWPKSDVAGFLPALSYFCRLLRQPELRERLRASETPEEAYVWLQLSDKTGRCQTGIGGAPDLTVSADAGSAGRYEHVYRWR